MQRTGRILSEWRRANRRWEPRLRGPSLLMRIIQMNLSRGRRQFQSSNIEKLNRFSPFGKIVSKNSFLYICFDWFISSGSSWGYGQKTLILASTHAINSFIPCQILLEWQIRTVVNRSPTVSRWSFLSNRMNWKNQFCLREALWRARTITIRAYRNQVFKRMGTSVTILVAFVATNL